MNRFLAGLLTVAWAGGITISFIELVKLAAENVKQKEDIQSTIDYTQGWMNGYLAGDKEFAEYLKKKNPELFKKIES